MSSFIDTMKEYVENARAKLAAAEQAHRSAAAELQVAGNDFAIWNNAYTLALKEKEKWQAEARETQLPMELPGTDVAPMESVNAPNEPAQPEINKTEKVRETLGKHVSGITPKDLWIEVKDFNVSRPYLYSVLKRLRDSKEVAMRRGKYVLIPKPLEVKLEEEMEVMTVQ